MQGTLSEVLSAGADLSRAMRLTEPLESQGLPGRAEEGSAMMRLPLPPPLEDGEDPERWQGRRGKTERRMRTCSEYSGA